MTTLFEPKGEKAQWRMVYDLFEQATIGDVITYDQIGEVLQCPKREVQQAAARKAAKEYLHSQNRAAESIRNKGYRIVAPSEHQRLAQAQQKRAKKALVKSRDVAVHVDLNGLDPAARQAILATGQAVGMLISMHRRLDLRQKNLEAAMASVSRKQDRTDDEVAELRRRYDEQAARIAQLEKVRDHD